ncbi:hypothetical protein C1886_07235 [Pseudomonas sp. FW300-N1A1]|uniref:hypothetical protein n=1 Tax=Pseudomonas sp. FW300-N1A1 TaxID=2075555 RepID=UPI000CD1C069|nr:hypothetical protein [Pseudomonas sp. FW300-N1A1]POA20765.1 hypothetical protein C1886_07235 [Pseudomonas sp. FW300-N1A1]
MKGLARRLMAGRLAVHHEMGVTVLNEKGEPIDLITPQMMALSDWGIVYERWIGLELEKDGWEIDYRGLALGFADQGIDLVAVRDGKSRYLQCKFVHTPFGKQQIEQILYKASQYLHHQALNRGDVFELIVPHVEKAFPLTRKKNKPPQENQFKRRFLGCNHIQSRIRLAITQIPMDIQCPIRGNPEIE